MGSPRDANYIMSSRLFGMLNIVYASTQQMIDEVQKTFTNLQFRSYKLKNSEPLTLFPKKEVVVPLI